MKIVRTPLGFNIDAAAVNEYEFPDVMRQHLEQVVTEAKGHNCTVDWSTLCALPEETRAIRADGEVSIQIRQLHVTVDGVEIIEEEA